MTAIWMQIEQKETLFKWINKERQQGDVGG